MSKLTDDLRSIVVREWGLSPEQQAAVERQDPTWVRPVALSLDIDSILGGQPGAEIKWMKASRKAFGGRSALAVLADDDGLAKIEKLLRDQCP